MLLMKFHHLSLERVPRGVRVEQRKRSEHRRRRDDRELVMAERVGAGRMPVRKCSIASALHGQNERIARGPGGCCRSNNDPLVRRRNRHLDDGESA